MTATPYQDRLATLQGVAGGLIFGALFVAGFAITLHDATWISLPALHAFAVCAMVVGSAITAVAVRFEHRHAAVLRMEAELEDAVDQVEVLDNPLVGVARLLRHVDENTTVAVLPMTPDQIAPLRAPAGIQEWDLIRRYTVRTDVTHVALYETAPVSAIVAVATVSTITNDSPGVAYAQGRPVPEHAHGARAFCRIALSDITWLTPPIGREEIGLWSAPRSIRYLTAQQTHQLAAAIGTQH